MIPIDFFFIDLVSDFLIVSLLIINLNEKIIDYL